MASRSVENTPIGLLKRLELSTWQFNGMKEIGFSPEKLHSIALDAIEQRQFDFSNGGTKFVTLAEHDKKYHPDGYDPDKESCGKRDNMEKVDPVDEKVKADAKAVVGGENQQKNAQKKVYTEEEKRKYWTEWLSRASDKQIDDLIDKYGDEKKYPNLCALIKAETDKRAKADMERWYRENGERA